MNRRHSHDPLTSEFDEIWLEAKQKGMQDLLRDKACDMISKAEQRSFWRSLLPAPFRNQTPLPVMTLCLRWTLAIILPTFGILTLLPAQFKSAAVAFALALLLRILWVMLARPLFLYLDRLVDDAKARRAFFGHFYGMALVSLLAVPLIKYVLSFFPPTLPIYSACALVGLCFYIAKWRRRFLDEHMFWASVVLEAFGLVLVNVPANAGLDVLIVAGYAVIITTLASLAGNFAKAAIG